MGDPRSRSLATRASEAEHPIWSWAGICGNDIPCAWLLIRGGSNATKSKACCSHTLALLWAGNVGLLVCCLLLCGLAHGAALIPYSGISSVCPLNCQPTRLCPASTERFRALPPVPGATHWRAGCRDVSEAEVGLWRRMVLSTEGQAFAPRRLCMPASIAGMSGESCVTYRFSSCGVWLTWPLWRGCLCCCLFSSSSPISWQNARSEHGVAFSAGLLTPGLLIVGAKDLV